MFKEAKASGSSLRVSRYSGVRGSLLKDLSFFAVKPKEERSLPKELSSLAISPLLPEKGEEVTSYKASAKLFCFILTGRRTPSTSLNVLFIAFCHS